MSTTPVTRCHGVEVRTEIDIFLTNEWHAVVTKGRLTTISCTFDTRDEAFAWAVKVAR